MRFYGLFFLFSLIISSSTTAFTGDEAHQTFLKNLNAVQTQINKKDFTKAKQLLKDIITQSRKQKDTVALLKGLIKIEHLYSEQCQNDSAITACYERLNLNRKLKNYKSLSDNFRALNTLFLSNLGNRTTNGLMDSCLFYALLSKDSLSIASAYTNYGLGLTSEKPELGIQYLRKAVLLSNSIKDPIIFLYSRIQTAKVLIERDSLEEATHLLNEAKERAISINEKIHLTHIYIALGSISIKELNYVEGIKVLIRAKNLAEAGPYNYYLPDIYSSLIEAYRKTNRLDSSLFYSEKLAYIQSILLNEKVNQQVAEVSAKYQLEEKESLIKKLGNRVLRFKVVFVFLVILSISIIGFFVVYLIKIKNSSNPRFQFVKGAKKNLILPKSFKLEFEKVFVNDEIFIQSDLTLQKLAEALNTNTTYLSRFINDEYKTNFSQLLNQFRIEKACKLLLSYKMNKLTIEAIAQAAGFSSKSTFNNAFRCLKGTTPTQWRETNKSL